MEAVHEESRKKALFEFNKRYGMKSKIFSPFIINISDSSMYSLPHSITTGTYFLSKGFVLNLMLLRQLQKDQDSLLTNKQFFQTQFFSTHPPLPPLSTSNQHSVAPFLPSQSNLPSDPHAIISIPLPHCNGLQCLNFLVAY